MLTQRHGVRLLGADDLDEFLALAAQDPVVNVFADYRARTTQLCLAGWAVRSGDASATADWWRPAMRGPTWSRCSAAARTPRRSPNARSPGVARVTTLVGPQEPVDAFWQKVAADWGTPRDIRSGQPHLEIAGPPRSTPDPEVRRDHARDLAALYPACVAMYTEEVGISPEFGRRRASSTGPGSTS